MVQTYLDQKNIFGNSGEIYAASLFQMDRKPNGKRMPDLVSRSGIYAPQLLVEVKSGASGRGILKLYQMAYGFVSPAEYERLFRENRPNSPYDFPQFADNLDSYRDAAFYFDVLKRTDGLTTKDLQKPFADVKLKYGDHYVIPHTLAMYLFAARKSVRKSEKFETSLYTTMDKIRNNIRRGICEEQIIYADRHAHQDVSSDDCAALFNDSLANLSASGNKRVELIREHYPGYADLRRVKIPGPKIGDQQTFVYALAEPAHEYLFSKQMPEVVGNNVAKMELVLDQRAKAETLLDKIVYMEPDASFDFEGCWDDSELTRYERLALDSLTRWELPAKMFQRRDLFTWGIEDPVPVEHPF